MTLLSWLYSTPDQPLPDTEVEAAGLCDADRACLERSPAEDLEACPWNRWLRAHGRGHEVAW